mmetsp:Transcript_15272/g.31058  ORF Transcript_15272/g.31058 Transcript_15272/m.31058 type:complete len:364 (+) Transcript_15272:278-1369(+)
MIKVNKGRTLIVGSHDLLRQFHLNAFFFVGIDFIVHLIQFLEGFHVGRFGNISIVFDVNPISCHGSETRVGDGTFARKGTLESQSNSLRINVSFSDFQNDGTDQVTENDDILLANRYLSLVHSRAANPAANFSFPRRRQNIGLEPTALDSFFSRITRVFVPNFFEDVHNVQNMWLGTKVETLASLGLLLALFGSEFVATFHVKHLKQRTKKVVLVSNAERGDDAHIQRLVTMGKILRNKLDFKLGRNLGQVNLVSRTFVQEEQCWNVPSGALVMGPKDVRDPPQRSITVKPSVTLIRIRNGRSLPVLGETEALWFLLLASHGERHLCSGRGRADHQSHAKLVFHCLGALVLLLGFIVNVEMVG